MKRHGISIGINRIGKELFVTLNAIGTLTHQDYETITPMLESALAEVPQSRIKVLLDATEMQGWELRAAWDDFKLGVKHGRKFDKIAIYGKPGWQELMAKVGNWFTSGEVFFLKVTKMR